MIAPDRDRAPGRRLNKQDRRRLAPADRVEKVKLEPKEIVVRKHRRENYVEVGHTTDYSRAAPPLRPTTTTLSHAPLAETRAGFRLPVDKSNRDEVPPPSLNAGCRGHPCPRRRGTHGGFHIQSVRSLARSMRCLRRHDLQRHLFSPAHHGDRRTNTDLAHREMTLQIVDAGDRSLADPHDLIAFPDSAERRRTVRLDRRADPESRV